MTFPESLQAARAQLGYTQPQMAVFLSISERTYVNWESGKTTPGEVCQEGAIARIEKATKPKKP